jgi:hypothetical protein
MSTSPLTIESDAHRTKFQPGLFIFLLLVVLSFSWEARYAYHYFSLNSAALSGEFGIYVPGRANKQKTVYYSLLHVPGARSIKVKLHSTEPMEITATIRDTKGNFVVWKPEAISRDYDKEIDVAKLSVGGYELCLFDYSGAKVFDSALK